MPFEISRATRLIAGITLLTVPTIQYGGYFLLRSLMDRQSGYMENALRQNFFRIYIGAVVLAASVLTLGVGLVRAS